MKFKVGDTVKFFRTGLSATGVLRKERGYVPHEWAVEVIPSSIKWERGMSCPLHICEGYFKERIGWYVHEKEMKLLNSLDEILGLY